MTCKRHNLTFGVQRSGRRALRTATMVLAACFFVLASTAHAQYRMDRLQDAGAAPTPNPQILDKAGAQVPLDLAFSTSENKTIALKELFNHDRPVIVSLVYFSCPFICGVNQDGIAGIVRQGPRDLKLGKDYDVVIVSIDPDDTPAEAAKKRHNYLKKIPLPDSQPGFTYLTGNESNIAILAETLGFGFRRQFEGDKFLHSSGIFVCTPAGRLSQTIQGVAFESDQVHYALVNASGGRLGRGLLGFARTCGAMRFNPATGHYEHNKYFYVGVAGALVSLIFVTTLLSILWRGEFKKNKHPFRAPPTVT